MSDFAIAGKTLWRHPLFHFTACIGLVWIVFNPSWLNRVRVKIAQNLGRARPPSPAQGKRLTQGVELRKYFNRIDKRRNVSWALFSPTAASLRVHTIGIPLDSRSRHSTHKLAIFMLVVLWAHISIFSVWTKPTCRMPDQISVSEFLAETTEDYNSPTTSSFTTRLQSCRNSVSVLEEVRPKAVNKVAYKLDFWENTRLACVGEAELTLPRSRAMSTFHQRVPVNVRRNEAITLVSFIHGVNVTLGWVLSVCYRLCSTCRLPRP